MEFSFGIFGSRWKLERALEREALEECGLGVRVKWLVGVYSEEGQAVVLVAYQADVVSGESMAGDGTSEARVFRAHAMPENRPA